MNLVLVLGNQLFAVDHFKKCLPNAKDVVVFMREDAELCTYYKFHKHKIIFFLAAMRGFSDELKKLQIKVHYEELSAQKTAYEASLTEFIKKNGVKRVSFFEIEDKFFEKRVLAALNACGLDVEIWPSPMFLTTRDQFKKYLGDKKRPFMKVFYEQQRKRLNILVDSKGDPIGGAWSFDTENRKALPSKVMPPKLEKPKLSAHVKNVCTVVNATFSSHPGRVEDFWLPTDRKGAQEWLNTFLKTRLADFGPYEDAIPQHSDFVFHSVLTPFLNCGLLTPKEVVDQTLAFAKKSKTPIASLEGFVRQIIGWREFIRGIYQNFSEKQETTNFFKHKRKLTNHWYSATTGIGPLDHAIGKANTFGYMHHIERLMVVGSLMLLLEIDPNDAHRWFMEMFIDSSDWVMGPNVYGMALFSDGGIFATKPYFCGSNYYRKMGPYKADESWCDGVDGLYWSFIEKHKAFFLKNPRLSMMVRTVEKMDAKKKARIFEAADQLRQSLTS
jgi:deoxyribodipyrimidine photolyase-related protein